MSNQSRYILFLFTVLLSILLRNGICQKNGGIIVTGINDADYVILFPPAGGSKTDRVHETFIGQAQAAGQPAVSARFVHDCLEQHTILDTEPYQFTPASHKRKRRRLDVLFRLI